MKRVIFSSFLGISLLFLAPLIARANVSCQPIYGGGQNCEQTGIVINKTVQNPQNGSYVDNLGVNDPKYSPDQSVNFQIQVTNSGNSPIGQTTVNDIFPQDVNFVSGPGSFNSTTNTLSFEVDNLNVNETRTFTITGQVVSNNNLPQDSGIICVVNQATAVTDNGDQAQDNAQFCIQKQTAPTTTIINQTTTTKGGLTVLPAPKIVATPSTGPEALPLLALLPTGFIGFLIRKKYTAFKS